MSRGQENQVFNTSQQQNQQANTNAQTSYTNAQTDIGNYQNQLASFAAANPYGAGGEYQTSENKIAANTSDAAAQAAGQAMQGASVRTGQNSAGAIAATEAGAQANERNLSSQESAANAARISSGAGYGQQVLNATAVPEGMEAGLAANQNSAATADLGEQQKAGMTPSLGEELMAGTIQAGTSFASGFGGAMCPAKGSLYTMADGSRKPVEDLTVGEWLLGIDGDPQEIEEIQAAPSGILKITTDDGFVARASNIHAFALPVGGFVVALHSLDRTILTEKGRGKVVSVERDGIELVFNVITGGSHTYCADGIWALGVGEAERVVSMAAWNRIGRNLEAQQIQPNRSMNAIMGLEVGWKEGLS